MRYLSFDEYTQMGGKLSEAEFDRFAYRAEKEIKNATFGRVETLCPIPEAVKRCMFELITYLSSTAANGGNQSVTNVSNDGYSVAYAEPKSVQSQIYDIIRTYLAEEENNLLYCGVD